MKRNKLVWMAPITGGPRTTPQEASITEVAPPLISDLRAEPNLRPTFKSSTLSGILHLGVQAGEKGGIHGRLARTACRQFRTTAPSQRHPHTS